MNDLTILHVSDLHFGKHFHPQVAEALLRDARRLAPDAIVASGDFTQRAKQSEFAAAREFLDSLPQVPRIVTPGNHDVPLYRVWERVFAPYLHYRRYISEELDTSLEVGGAVFVSINSSAPRTMITNGWISNEQLDFAERVFRKAPAEQTRIVVAHHHFAPAPDYEWKATMPRYRRALERFARMKVDLILGGHLHRAYIGNSLDVHAGGDRDRGIIIVQSGTSTSRRGRAREREKNSFNLIRVSDAEVRITHYMYFEDLGRFAPLSGHHFPRAAQRILPEEATPLRTVR